MAGARFDIKFAGELMGDANPEEVRRELQQRFKLSDAAAARLFGGHPVTVKRGVDTATASRYREVFREAKALVQILPVSAPTATTPTPDTDRASAAMGAEPETPARSESDDGGLGLAPDEDNRPLERTPIDAPPAIDVSHLSLVPGQDWTLEDCQSDIAPVALPDIGHLKTIVPPRDEDETRGNATKEPRES